MDEDVADAVHERLQLGVGEGPVQREQAWAITVPVRHPPVEQRDHAVHARRIPIGVVPVQDFRPEFPWRKVVACEAVDMC